MSHTAEERAIKFEEANAIAQHLYSSSESGTVLREIFTKHALAEALYRPYALAVGDVILGFNQQGELPGLLKERLQLTDQQAIKLTADLVDFLAPLSDPDAAAKLVVKTQPDATDTDVANPATVPTPVAPAAGAALLTDIAETQAALDAVQPIRTMGDDMDRLGHGSGDAPGEGGAPTTPGSRWESEVDDTPVHRSSQDHILGQRPKLGDTPSYTPDEPRSGGTRWGS